MDPNSEVSAPEWVANVKDDGLKETLSKYETQDKFLETIGYQPPDWRQAIQDEDGKKFAADSTDINHLVRRAVDLRKQVSNAIIRPGKDAKPEQIAAYHKALGIPEKPEDYEFPELSKEDLTEEVQQSRKVWSSRFHELGVSKTAAKKLSGLLNEDLTKAMQAQQKADKDYAEAQETQLREEWKGDYDKNKTIANRAFNEIANRSGIKIDDLTKIEMKNGRFLMDQAEIVKLFATLGREMSEGTLGPVLTDADREGAEEQLATVRKQISEAQSEGNSKRANSLYQKEQALLGRIHGDKSIAA